MEGWKSEGFSISLTLTVPHSVKKVDHSYTMQNDGGGLQLYMQPSRSEARLQPNPLFSKHVKLYKTDFYFQVIIPQ